MRKFIAFATSILFLKSALFGGNINIADIKLYTVADGLSQSNVNAIIQDSKGFIWIGTENGLNRFDGYEFTVYSNQPNDSNTISNNFINAICEDKNGSIWIATNNGLNCLNTNTGKIKTYYHNNKKANSLSDNEVLNVFIDHEGTLWVKTLKTLEKFNAEKGVFTSFTHFNDVFYFLSSNIALPIVEDNNNRLWVGTKDGLNFFEKDLQLFNRQITLEYNPNSISNNEVRSLAIDNHGIIWVGTAKGLNEYNPNKKLFNRYYLEIDGAKSTVNKINALLVDKNNLIWVGTNNGLFGFDVLTKKFIKPNINQNEDLINIPVFSISKDKSGIIWVGTNKGLLKLNTNPKKFRLLGPQNKEINLPALDFSSIFLDEDDNCWIGTNGKGLLFLNRNTNKISYYTNSIDDDRYNYINCIQKGSGNLLILGTNNGVVFFNRVTNKFQNLCSGQIEHCDLLEQVKVNSILQDFNSDIIIGANNGLFLYKSDTKQLTNFNHNPDDKTSICNDKINVLHQDASGVIWVGTDNGLDKFFKQTRKFSHVNLNYKGKTVASQTINCLKVDLDGLMWIGTSSGVVRLNQKDNSLQVFTEKNGLSDNSIFSIEVDQNNSVWLSTNRGINKINSTDFSITSYDINDGLQDYEFNLNTSATFKSGELIFGGISGLNIFNPDSLYINNYVPQIEITSVEIITTKQKISWNNILDSEISVPYGSKVLTINFSSLDFTLSDKNTYSYKLYSVNEEEPDWIFIGKKHAATVSNLKPGEYYFKVKGSNNDGVWNETGKTIIINVESTFWLKPQAIYLYIFVGVILLLGIYRYRTYNLRKTNRILKDKEVASLEVERQREQLAIKNKNITDSINYAKRIQEALMPSAKSIKRILPESFVFHQPKDIVSGDFFWVSERGNKIFVAAVDCTGHGVPGAFMSIIGFELFRKITHSQGIENPSQILSILNKEFEEIFRDVDNYVLRDGMDIAFCVIDKKTKLLEYSGAVNPIYLIRDDKITEIVGSRFSVGLDSTPEEERGFENKQIVLQDDDVIYLFSDGYADQFGGPEAKKFKYRRFRHLLLTLHKYPMEEQHDLLAERINRWKGELDQVDDMLIIGFRPNFNLQ